MFLFFPGRKNQKEGLGLVVVVERRLLAYQCYYLMVFLEDAIEIPDLANFITLDNNPAEWAEKL
ncbi:MAG: hypothetical protein IPF70_00025 [Saprospiraceae bacterium]|nr:hypothetical protein [Saprospiraceae bacterium]